VASGEDAVCRETPVPDVPFEGARYVDDLDPALLLPYVNRQTLFRGRRPPEMNTIMHFNKHRELKEDGYK